MLRAAVVLAITSLVVALPAGSSDAAASKSVTIRVIETPVTQSLTKDVPPRTARLRGKFTKGDTVSETAILLNVVPQFGWPKGATAGSLSRVIVALSPRTVRDESVAKFLGGTVHVRGESKAVPDHGVGFHHVFFKQFVVVIGSVDIGEDGGNPSSDAALRVLVPERGSPRDRQLDRSRDPRGEIHPRCLIRAVRSCTRLYTALSSEIIRVIFAFAWRTVEWSRPPNSLPIFGSDASVSSRERYIATWRG